MVIPPYQHLKAGIVKLVIEVSGQQQIDFLTTLLKELSRPAGKSLQNEAREIYISTEIKL